MKRINKTERYFASIYPHLLSFFVDEDKGDIPINNGDLNPVFEVQTDGNIFLFDGRRFNINSPDELISFSRQFKRNVFFLNPRTSQAIDLSGKIIYQNNICQLHNEITTYTNLTFRLIKNNKCRNLNEINDFMNNA